MPGTWCAQGRLQAETSTNLLPAISPPDLSGVFEMQDALMLLFTAVFFGVAFLYVKACQKLR